MDMLSKAASSDLSPAKKRMLLAELLRQKAGRPRSFPLSFAQQRLWFLDRLEPGIAPYNIPAVVRLSGPLNVAALQQSLEELVRRHESLRTTFRLEADQPVQVIDPPTPFHLIIRDLSGYDAVRREKEVQRLIREEAEHPFDLAQGSLLRTVLLRLQCDEHILLHTMHHIISDGWSSGVLMRELGVLYSAFVEGKPSPLPSLPVQYADYSLWQRQWLQGETLQTQLAYWTKQLDGVMPLDLPIDHPHPPIATFCGSQQNIVLPVALRDQLKALSQQSGVTLFMTLLAAFQVLLSRYSGQSDIAVGTPIANRMRQEIEGLIGLLVNTLVMRTDLSGNPTFQEVLERVSEVALGAFTHQDVPFEKLVEVLQPERHLSRTPLFQVMFILQNLPIEEETKWADITVQVLAVDSLKAKFDLTLALTDTAQGLRCELVYNTDLFEAGTITRLLGHWRTLLEGIVAHPERCLSDLPLLTESERHQLLVEWNNPVGAGLALAPTCPDALSVHQLIEAQVERTPDAVAVSCADEQLTYQQLNQRANSTARYLVECGVGSEIPVALLAERGIAFLTATLAIFKANGIYLPLDPAHPATRLSQVLKQSRCAFILTARAFEPVLLQALEALPVGERPRLLQLEALFEQKPAPANLPDRCLPANLAYVIYTSGSTGLPKGAMIAHAGMLNHLYAKINQLQLCAGDVVAQTASQCFDISVWQLLAALLVGGRVQVVANELAHDPRHLLAQVEQQAITILETVPSLLQALLDELEAARSQCPLPALRWVMPTGEALPPALCRRWLQLYPHIPLINAYGPTECSDDVTHYAIEQSPPAAMLVTPIGRPIDNIRLYVLDAWMQPVPVGVYGQLYVAGQGVGRGYLHDGSRTAELFVPNPFVGTSVGTRLIASESDLSPTLARPNVGTSHAEAGSYSASESDLSPTLARPSLSPSIPGERLYKSGDIVRYLPDGTLEYRGRADQQVKVRGYRIELGEIEAALSGHPAVRESFVLAHDSGGARGKQLVAYIVCKEHTDSSIAELRSYLRGKLPDYMLPSHFILLEALPLTPNGKVDRRSLPTPADKREDGWDEGVVLARNPIEEMVAAIWEEVLEIPPANAAAACSSPIHRGSAQAGGKEVLARTPIGIHENFFELGGHSLLTTRVVSRIQKLLHVDLPLRTLFESPTIAGLAEQITLLLHGERTGEIFPLVPVGREAPLPLSFAQQRLWFLDQLEAGSTLYLNPSAQLLRGVINVMALDRSLQALVVRHESLRTVFREAESGPAQVIQSADIFRMPLVDLQGVERGEREREARQLARQEASHPADLTRGPLLRTFLLRLGSEEHILLLTMHHIITDGWSGQVFVRELTTLYRAFLQGQPSPLSPLPVQYADFAVWQRRWMQGEALADQLAYWRRQLGGFRLLELPTDRPRCAVQSQRGATSFFALPTEQSAALVALSRREGVTLFMLLLTAFQIVLHHYTGQTDIAVGTDVANRSRLETEDLIGFFVNQLVLRTDLAGNPTLHELLMRVKHTVLEAYLHQDLPFEKLVEVLKPQRNSLQVPFFQAKINFQTLPTEPFALLDLQSSPLEMEVLSARHDLTLWLFESAKGVNGSIAYNADLFHASTIKRLIDYFKIALDNIVSHPEVRLDAVEMMTREEREQQSREKKARFNTFKRSRPGPVSLPQVTMRGNE